MIAVTCQYSLVPPPEKLFSKLLNTLPESDVIFFFDILVNFSLNNAWILMKKNWHFKMAGIHRFLWLSHYGWLKIGFNIGLVLIELKVDCCCSL